MSGKHQHDHHEMARGGEKNIAFAFFLNFGFTIIEIIGGLWTNSIAVLSDALHDMGDTLSLGLAWYFQRIGQKGSDKTFTFGYSRFNILGAFINALVLVLGSIVIFSQAIQRLWSTPQPHVEGMMIMAVLGISVNGLAVLRLRKGPQSLNEEVITWHLLEDVLGWVAVLIGSIIMYFFDLPIIDPLLSILITSVVVFNVIKKLVRATRIFLQAIPDGVDIKKIRNALSLIDNVKEVHHTHLWTLDGNYHVLTVHISVDQDLKVGELKPFKDMIRKRLLDFNIDHATIEVESWQDKEDRFPMEVE